MATTVYDVEEIQLQNGATVKLKPLTIKELREFMKVIQRTQEVTTEDEISRREKECDLSHIFEDIWLSDWTDMMGEMNSDEQFAYIKKELEAYDA